jgi:hypothetical protein
LPLQPRWREVAVPETIDLAKLRNVHAMTASLNQHEAAVAWGPCFAPYATEDCCPFMIKARYDTLWRYAPVHFEIGPNPDTYVVAPTGSRCHLNMARVTWRARFVPLLSRYQ